MPVLPPTTNSNPERPFEPERPTGPRYSLINGVVEGDWLVRHPSGSLRMVIYPKPEGLHEMYRQKMVDKKLVLGRYQPSRHKGYEYVQVPRSSRPLAYEASTSSEGAYTNNDRKVFFELGSLLAGVSKLDESLTLVINQPIEYKVALIEFTQPEDKTLFLIPGAEYFLSPLEEGINPVSYYADQLKSLFVHRFQANEEQFMAGFRSPRIA